MSQSSVTEGFKHGNEHAQSSSRIIAPPAPPSAMRAVPRHIQLADLNNGKNEESEAAPPETTELDRGLIPPALARSHTIDGNTLEDMTK